jgi:excisionase family DNA binding protein
MNSMISTQNEKMLLTPRETAKALSICEKTLYALTKSGELRAIKIGRSVRYSVDDINNWIRKSLENN